ncbi:cellulase family glycosylhydrolase [Natrinema sp. 74]|uniref:cellulase family glycosylhydrolase n=1 Tax=Natrinema sp. 74 TaxID=3384159 RepID=UPI0038D49DD3
MTRERVSRRTAMRGVAGGVVGSLLGRLPGWFSEGSTTNRYGPALDLSVPDGGCPRPSPSKLQAHTSSNGSFFVRDDGRIAILQGANMVDKTKQPPHYPASEISSADIKRIASWGFNFVRLGIQWAKLTPTRPPSPSAVDSAVDESYVTRLRTLVRNLARHDVSVLLDMHQDFFSDVFDGNGAPKWAVYDDNIPFVDTDPWWTSYLQPAVLAAFDNFWENRGRIQEYFARMWRTVADRFGTETNVVGYDIFNEPTPGSGSPISFEREWLTPFTNRVIERIREVDDDTAIWVEPGIFFGGGIPSRIGRVDDPADNVAFSFHSYPELLADADRVTNRLPVDFDVSAVGHRHIARNAVETADRLGAVPVMTEFGAHPDPADVRDGLTAAADAMIGWAYWQYKPWNGTPRSWLYSDGHVSKNLHELVRPYPQAIAGYPESWSYDRESRRFALEYRPRRGVNPDTVVYVPERAYGGAYELTVNGGTPVCRTREYVHVRHQTAEKNVTISITPEDA